MRKGGDVCFSQVFRDGRGETHSNWNVGLLILPEAWGFVCFTILWEVCICDCKKSLWTFFHCFLASIMSDSLMYYCCFLGTTGIVDYTNYDDMKYAVSICFSSFCGNIMYYYILDWILWTLLTWLSWNVPLCRLRSLMTLSFGMHFLRLMSVYEPNLIFKK